MATELPILVTIKTQGAQLLRGLSLQLSKLQQSARAFQGEVGRTAALAGRPEAIGGPRGVLRAAGGTEGLTSAIRELDMDVHATTPEVITDALEAIGRDVRDTLPEPEAITNALERMDLRIQEALPRPEQITRTLQTMSKTIPETLPRPEAITNALQEISKGVLKIAPEPGTMTRTIQEIDRAIRETLPKPDEIANTLQQMGKSVSEAVPEPKAITNALQEIGQEIQGILPEPEVITNTLQDMSMRVLEKVPEPEAIVDRLERMSRGVQEAFPRPEAISNALQGIGERAGDRAWISGRVLEGVPKPEAVVDRLERMNRSVQEALPEPEAIVSALQEMNRNVLEVIPEPGAMTKTIQEMDRKTRDALPKPGDITNALQEMSRGIQETLPKPEAVTDTLQKMSEGVQKALPEPEVITNRLQGMSEGIQETLPRPEAIVNALQEIGRGIAGITPDPRITTNILRVARRGALRATPGPGTIAGTLQRELHQPDIVEQGELPQLAVIGETLQEQSQMIHEAVQSQIATLSSQATILGDVTRIASAEQLKLAGVLIANVTKLERWHKVILVTGNEGADAFIRVKKALVALAATPATINVESLRAVTEEINVLLAIVRQNLQTLLATPGEVPDAAVALTRMKLELEKLQAQIQNYGVTSRRASRATAEHDGVIRSLGGGYRRMREEMSQADLELRELGKEARRGALTWRPYQSIVHGVMMGMSIATGNIQGLLFNLIFLGFSIRGTAIRWAALSVVVFGFISIVRRVTQAIRNLIEAFSSTGRAVDTLMNQLRPFVATTRDMGRAFDYATAQAVKYGQTSEDVAKAMTTLAEAGFGTHEMLEAVAIAAVANGKQLSEAASIIVDAIGEEEKNLEALHDLRITISEDMIATTNRAAAAETTRLAIIEQLSDVYRDVAHSGEHSINRIGQGWRAIISYFTAPVWQKVFIPILHYLANFIASLVELARGLAFSQQTQRHLNETMAIFYATLREYAPELRAIARFIRSIMVVAFQLLLNTVRALVTRFRTLMRLVRAMMPVFRRLAAIVKGTRDALATLFPKGLGERIRMVGTGVKEGVLNIWEHIQEHVNRLRDRLARFFTEHPIGAAIAVVFNWAWGSIARMWERLKESLIGWWERVGRDWVTENPLKALILGVRLGGLLVKLAPWLFNVFGRMFSLIGPAMLFGLKTLLLAAKKMWLAASVFVVVDLVIETIGNEQLQATWDELKRRLMAFAEANPIMFVVGVIGGIKLLDWLYAALITGLGNLSVKVTGLIVKFLHTKVMTTIATFLAGLPAFFAKALPVVFAVIKAVLIKLVAAAAAAVGTVFLGGFALELITGVPIVSDALNSLLNHGLWPMFLTFGHRLGQGILVIVEEVLKAIQLIVQRMPNWMKDVLGINEEWEVNWFDAAYKRLQAISDDVDSELTQLKNKWGGEQINVKVRADIDEQILAQSPSMLETSIRGIGDAMQDMQRMGAGLQIGNGGSVAPVVPRTGDYLKAPTAIALTVNVTGNTIVGAEGARGLADTISEEIMRKLTRKYPLVGVR